jgi:transposase
MVHKNINTDPKKFIEIISPYLEDVAVAVECMFSWYWLADLCLQHKITFVLGHALYMKAIHGVKTKNDRIDSQKIALLLKAGMIPKAYVYPAEMRSTRDLLRRRMHLMYKRSELFAHIENTKTQYNLPDFKKKIAYKANREGVIEHFEDTSVRKNVEVDLAMLNAYDEILMDVELFILKHAKAHDANTLYLLQTVPGIGKILSLVILYEVHDVNRFPRVQEFLSYARLVKPRKESAGKTTGKANGKIGNAHLKWAFSEASVLLVRQNENAKRYVQKMEAKHGKGKAFSILAARIGRTVYFMLKNKKAFDMKKFFNQT